VRAGAAGPSGCFSVAQVVLISLKNSELGLVTQGPLNHPSFADRFPARAAGTWKYERLRSLLVNMSEVAI
jgi:hypothetical protein